MTHLLLADPDFSIVLSLRTAFEQMAAQVVAFLPKAVVALVLTGVGYVIARFLASLVAASFAKTGLDKVVAESSAGKALARVGLKAKAGAVLGRVLFWVLFLFVLKTAADAADIKDISAIIVSVFAFLPRLLVATIILAAGFLAADLVRTAVSKTLSAFGVDYAHSLSSILFGFILIIVLTVSLSQIGVETELLNATVKILVGGLAAALAIAMGLGLKEFAREIVAGVYARDLYRPGTQVEFDGEMLVVVGVGPVTSKLRQADGTLLIVPNTRLSGETRRARPTEDEKD